MYGAKRHSFHWAARIERGRAGAALRLGPGAGPEIDDPIGPAHHPRIVFHHDDRVAQVAQPFQHDDQPIDVSRMQADGRLVEHDHYGFDPQVTGRATQAFIGTQWAGLQFWDGRATGLFEDPEELKRSEALMNALDAINGRMGSGTVRLLGEGTKKSKKTKKTKTKQAKKLAKKDQE